jgi:hypothetical protein
VLVSRWPGHGAPIGFCDFTFHRTDGAEHHLLGWAFYYRGDTLLDLARSRGLNAQVMTDWKRAAARSQRSASPRRAPPAS